MSVSLGTGHQNFNRSRTGAASFWGTTMKRLSYSVSPIVTGVATLSARSSSGTVFEWPTTSARSCGFSADSARSQGLHVRARQLLRRQAQRVGQRLGRLDGAPAGRR